MSLVFLLAAGCKDRQEPVTPEEPPVVRKRIEASQPPAVQAVKPGDIKVAAPVSEEAPPKPEAPEPPPPELAKATPPAEEAPALEVKVGTEAVVEKPDKEAEVAAGAGSEAPLVAQVPPAGTFTITLASFKPKQGADQYVEKLKKLGIDAYIWEVNLPEKGRWYRVSVGHFPTLKEAKSYKEELKQKGISDTYITKTTESS
jgi:septal ring-binding cell division protein DamX